MKELVFIASMLLVNSCLVSCKSELKTPVIEKEIVEMASPSKSISNDTRNDAQRDADPKETIKTPEIKNSEEKTKEKINPLSNSNTPSTQKRQKPAKQEIQASKELAPETKDHERPVTAVKEEIKSVSELNQVKIEQIKESPTNVVEVKSEPIEKVKEVEKAKEVAQELTPREVEEEKVVTHSLNMHQEWNYLLSEYVSASGKVNYSGIINEKNRLENYLALISNNPPKDDWSRNKKLAYWINAYNAYTVKLIIDNYPLKSITDLEGGKPWDKKWIKIGAKTYSLNNIENDIIRPVYQEPRIHFAVNCAAKSCPPLRNEAWNADKLEQQFESSTKKFINSKHNSIASGKAKISKIFEWYGADFKDLKGFLQKYSGEKIDEITYGEYDWSLNN